MKITFTTRELPAEGDLSAISSCEVTAQPEDRPISPGDWWTFELPRDGGEAVVQVAPATGLDLKSTLRRIAEDLLLIFKIESDKKDALDLSH